MSRLLLVRHGETELMSSERLWGRTDVELSALGLQQAERLRDRLAEEKIDAVYSSSLQRAATTAKIIASRHQLPVTPIVELREFNYGKIEGLNYEEIRQFYPDLHEVLMEHNPNLKFPAGESLADMGKRVRIFVSSLKKHAEEESILVVAHSGVLRTIICNLLGLSAKHFYQFEPDLASLSIMEIAPQGAVLRLFSDICHLDGI